MGRMKVVHSGRSQSVPAVISVIQDVCFVHLLRLVDSKVLWLEADLLKGRDLWRWLPIGPVYAVKPTVARAVCGK